MTPLKPLFPSHLNLELFETTSYTTSSIVPDFKNYQDLPSLDDAAKPWDFRVFFYLFFKNDDFCAGVEYFLACALQQLSYSDVYLKSLGKNVKNDEKMICGTNFLHLSAKKAEFWNCQAKDFYKDLFDSVKINFFSQEQLKSLQNLEISYFFDLDQNELSHVLVISEFERMIKNHTGKFCKLTKNYSEKTEKNVLNAIIQKHIAYNPEMITSRHLDGSLLVALFYDSSGVSSVYWEHTRKIRPFFHE